MRSLLILSIAILFSIACDVPREIQNSPSNNTNTSGTTGSAPMTEKPATVGTGTSGRLPDTTATRKDSIPQ